MLRTQVEFETADNRFPVYWINHDRATQVPLRVNKGVRIAEEPEFCKINRVFTTLRDENLPAVAKIGTIVELN